ncbi:MAG: hypothetical protein FWF42_03695 [Streptococcaceae bacterium]|nr:hypothetical protein [Streptococcaceae bacterium]
MEIVNALALDDWDNHGRKPEFENTWKGKYMNEAKELMTQMVDLLKINNHDGDT